MLKSSSLNLTWAIAFSLALVILACPVIAQAWSDYLIGGQGWRQGDWLINLGSGFVRRGIVGEALIMLSDVTGASLLVLVQIFQMSLFLALVFVIWVIGLTHGRGWPLVFLTASPAFVLFFWAGDPVGTMRKELFGLLALAFLTVSGIKTERSVVFVTLAIILYTLGCISNILHFFMAPSIVAGLYLLMEGKQISRRSFEILAFFTFVMSTLWMAVAFWFRDVSELAGMCNALVTRGFEESFCGWALNWMVAGNVDHIAVLLELLTLDALVRYFVVVVFSLLPIALSFFVFRERKLLCTLVAITFVSVLPLYAIAIDWGRWISTSYTSCVFLLILAHDVGKLTCRENMPSTRITYPLVVSAFLVSPAHDIGWRPGGAIRSLLSTIADFV